jgi:hypothetical protein
MRWNESYVADQTPNKIPERSVQNRSKIKEMCLIGNLIRLTNGENKRNRNRSPDWYKSLEYSG